MGVNRIKKGVIGVTSIVAWSNYNTKGLELIQLLQVKHSAPSVLHLVYCNRSLFRIFQKKSIVKTSCHIIGWCLGRNFTGYKNYQGRLERHHGSVAICEQYNLLTEPLSGRATLWQSCSLAVPLSDRASLWQSRASLWQGRSLTGPLSDRADVWQSRPLAVRLSDHSSK